MLLFEHKQCLQSYDAETSMQNRDIVFENSGSLMPTKWLVRDYNEWVTSGSDTSLTQIHPAPRNIAY